ncbi:MAG: hypothetical protein A3H43_02480 [Gammaproteobacteria bacterium RIFCSPLOWO2_02_FULL_42_9]|nr:MAG: hypothetical protein A3H43_02480 [Gammaproteobacteria bacterium RIFCSPLOWO2_02_FULL_42_9]
MFKLQFTDIARAQLEALRKNKSLKKRAKAVLKTLAYLEADPRHPSLNTHKYTTIIGSAGEEIFEAYAENNTPAAYRIFWYYGSKKKQITIVAITPHP